MSIGSTINTSLPAVGTTVNALAKAKQGVFSIPLTVSSEIAPVVLTLRASNLGNFNFKAIGLTYKYNPSINDSPNDAGSGNVTCSINVNARVGAVMTKAEILNHIRYALSSALKTDLLEALYDGILE
jgi:hypothetical protein